MSRPKHEALQTRSDLPPERMASLPWHGSSARLLQLVRERAAAAPQLVHDRFADDIHRVVYRVLGPDPEHEDVVNQAFVEILRGMHQVRDESRLTAWVLLSHAAAGKPLISSTLPPTPVPEPASLALPSTSAPVAAAPEQVPSVTNDFRTLARSGKHAEALAEAERTGFEQLTRTLGAADLALLADVARYQKQSGPARKALLALRQRHPAAPQTATATFLLGRMAAEQQRDYRSAASWFATYMSENRNGAMASEALGRQVQMLEQAGDREQAREVASRYLQRFPKGPYAELARGLLAGESLKTAP